MGLSAWKVMLVAGVVVLLFLPRFIRMGDMLKGLGERFSFPGDDRTGPQGHGYAGDDAGAAVIDGNTGMIVQPEAPVAKPSLAERIGLALGRMVRRVGHRLSA